MASKGHGLKNHINIKCFKIWTQSYYRKSLSFYPKVCRKGKHNYLIVIATLKFFNIYLPQYSYRGLNQLHLTYGSKMTFHQSTKCPPCLSKGIILLTSNPKRGPTSSQFSVHCLMVRLISWKLKDNKAMPSKFWGKAVSILKFYTQPNYESRHFQIYTASKHLFPMYYFSGSYSTNERRNQTKIWERLSVRGDPAQSDMKKKTLSNSWVAGLRH